MEKVVKKPEAVEPLLDGGISVKKCIFGDVLGSLFEALLQQGAAVEPTGRTQWRIHGVAKTNYLIHCLNRFESRRY